jgi:hypothetical protein
MPSDDTPVASFEAFLALREEALSKRLALTHESIEDKEIYTSRGAGLRRAFSFWTAIYHPDPIEREQVAEHVRRKLQRAATLG